MTPRSLLVRISTAQLAAGLAGCAVAVLRRRDWDLRQPWLNRDFLHGSSQHIARDSLWAGTAYSAPGWILATQWWATRNLAAGPDDGARRILGMFGAVMTLGYLGERHVRAHLRPGGWDPLETPVVAAGLGLAGTMAVLGHRSASGE